ncbi:hypothetical protein ACFLYU_05325 [Candidatus Dependentiae bacterium]
MRKSQKFIILLSIMLILHLSSSNIRASGSWEKHTHHTGSNKPKNQDFYLNYHNYKQQTKTWVKKYILDENNELLIYPKEMQLIANLIYFSLMRSYYTLYAQDEALKTLDILWKGWQNIAQTRLDPSQEAPYSIQEHEKLHSLERFWQLHDTHQKTGKTYAKAVELVAKGDFLITIHAKDAVLNMRNQARTVVAQSILDVKQYLGELFYSPKSPYNKKNSKNALSFFEYIWDYLPQLAIHSFVKASKTNDLVSDESWAILMKIQQVGAHTWQTIEQERASFYLAFYKAIWKIIHALDLEHEYRKITFDEYGFLDLENSGIPNDHYNMLPEPQNLKLY